MEEMFTDTGEMDGYEDDLLYSLMAGSAASAFRPRQPVHSCSCEKRLDELISLIGKLRDEIRERS